MRVIIDYNLSLDNSYHDGKQFGDWRDDYSFEIVCARKAADDEPTPYGSEGFIIPDEFEEVHVLWIRYSDGDSFGRAEGKGAIVGAFGDIGVANEAMKRLRAQEDDYTIEVKDDLGRQISMHNPGAGYFESIDSFNLETFSLKTGGRQTWYR